MDNSEIVEKIVKEDFVKKTIEFIARSAYEQTNILQDLEQDIYVQLLTMDNDKLNNLWKKKQWQFFITRVIINNIRSNTSPYYIKYRKFSNLSEEITYITDIENGNDTEEDN